MRILILGHLGVDEVARGGLVLGVLLGLGKYHLERIRLEQLQLGQDLEHPILVGQFDAAAVLDEGKDLLLVLPMSKGVFTRQ